MKKVDTNLIFELGGNFLSIYKKNSGLIFKEPSLLAVSMVDGQYEIKGFGDNAKTLASIEDPNINIFSPFSGGKIKSFDYAAILLSLALKKAGVGSFLGRKKAVMITNCGFEWEDKQQYDKLFASCGIKITNYVPSVVGVALFDGLDEFSEKHMLVAEIGASTSNVAVISSQGILFGSCLGIGGKNMTIGVMNMIAKKHGLQVSIFAAEKIKEELASMVTYDDSSVDIKGTDINSGEQRVATIKAADVREVILPYFEEILKQVEAVLNLCNDEVLKQIKMVGITLGGQVCKTAGIENFFKQRLTLQTHTVEEIEDAAILGIAKTLKNKQLLKNISYIS